MTKLNPVIDKVTQRIAERSAEHRAKYLDRIAAAKSQGPLRGALSCSNLAHGFAACGDKDKKSLRGDAVNIGVVTAYNDMLSAHQPLATYPDIIKRAAGEVDAVAQVAGGVPAMCDGVTQGQPGMELSLFSRDVIAMATAVSLSHNMFDAALCLGVCDKIVPGLLIGALSFGHLPTIFVPAGPMRSGLSNEDKARIRKQFAKGEVTKKELLTAESRAYHSPGTCTFYGTANSNQMLMEFMGLHLPGTAFINPGTDLRDALTAASAKRVVEIARARGAGIGELMDVKNVVNGVIGLMATGGSTNHALHLVAMARAAGYVINWTDFAELSAVTPLLCRVYPSGTADVNHFHAAGGLAFVIRELLDAGLVHEDVTTVAPEGKAGLRAYTQVPEMADGELVWRDGPSESRDKTIVAPTTKPFQPNGGMQLIQGNLGRGVIKISAVKPENRLIEAPARVFHTQQGFLDAFKAGEMESDVIVVVRFQGPSINGMPELHGLTPSLGVMQDKGIKVALVTDGRMSGASGKVPSSIHMTPEAALGGPLAKVRDGDLLRLDAEAGTLEALVDKAEWNARERVTVDPEPGNWGMGRELFAPFRKAVGVAEEGATVLSFLG